MVFLKVKNRTSRAPLEGGEIRRYREVLFNLCSHEQSLFKRSQTSGVKYVFVSKIVLFR